MSLCRTEEALREYLTCLSIEPDCKLARTEAQKVNPTSDSHISLMLFIKSSSLSYIILHYTAHKCLYIFVCFSSQLLSDLLAPVTDQVPEHISDYSNILSSRAHIKNNISARFQVGDVLTPDREPSLNKTRHTRFHYPLLPFFSSLRPLVPACCLLSPALLPLLLHLRG